MGIKTTVVGVTASLLLCSVANADKRQAFTAEVQRLHAGNDGKMHPMLRALANSTSQRGRDTLFRHLPHDGTTDVAVNVVANGDANALASQLKSLGMTHATVFGSMVSGRVSITALKALVSVDGVQSVRPARARTHAGLVTSQGDVSQHSDRARQRYNVTGRGVRVGILSDSFGCLTGPIFAGQMFTTTAQDIASNDLPVDVKILSDSACNGSNDEGRAIGQIIHDVAPGASIAFHTAFISEADFAQGIIDLADAGSTIIVDDVGYFDEPMFQDGIVAQAVDTVKKRGVAYFSSAGNAARQSYESEFRKSNSVGISGLRHNFGTKKNPAPMQTITVTDGGLEGVFLNWDEPFKSAGGKGSRSDVDLIYYDMDGNPIPECDDNLQPAVCQFPGVTSNIGGDAYEEGDIVNTSGADVQVQLSIELYEGPAPNYLKYVYEDFGDGTMTIDTFDTQSGSSYGHPIAAGAEAVGAAAWYNTAAWNSALHPGQCYPGCLEYFSSAGGVPIFFDKKGNRLARPERRLKPEITAPDGGNSTFFYSLFTFPVPGSTEPDAFPNFFGTSAAAPHAAGIAALMIEKHARSSRKPLSPDKIYHALEDTALDLKFAAGRALAPYLFPFGTRGFDFDSGYGLVNAPAALDEIDD